MFDFFKKKKPDNSQASPSKNVQKSPAKSPSKAPEPKPKVEDESEYEWLVEVCVQYLVSPIWKLNINSFMDENCIIFEDTEENSLEHLKTHKEFVKMVDDLLSAFIEDIQVSQEDFGKAVLVGVNIPDYKEYFDQLFSVDSFLVFKKQMVRRNKELEIEALEAMEKENMKDGEDEERFALEKEKADIDYALELSKQQVSDIQQINDEDEKMLQEVLRISEMAYKEQKTEEDKLIQSVLKQSAFEHEAKVENEKKKVAENEAQKKKAEEEAKKKAAEDAKRKAELEKKAAEAKKKIEEAKKKKEAEEAMKKKEDDTALHPLLARLENEKAIMEKLTTDSKDKSKAANLPPIRNSAFPAIGTNKPKGQPSQWMAEMETKKAEVEKRLEKMPEVKEETMQERKKRLLAQREKLLAAKKMQRQDEVKKYEELKGEIASNPEKLSPPKVVTDESEKRSSIYAMMKEL